MSGALDDLPPPSSLDDLPPPATAANDSGQPPSRPLGLMTGLGEAALHIGSGMASPLVEGAQNIYRHYVKGQDWSEIGAANDLLPPTVPVYQPKTAIGQAVSSGADWVGQQLDTLGGWAAKHAASGLGPEGVGLITDPTKLAYLQSGVHAATMALAPRMAGVAAGPALAGAKAVGGAVADTAKAAGGATADLVGGFTGKEAPAPTITPENLPSQFGTAGAQGANILGRISTASKEFQDDVLHNINDAQQEFGAAWKDHVNWDALDRQLNANSVGGSLTPGEAAQHGPTISEEWNKRSTNGLAEFYGARAKAMGGSLQDMREQSVPDVNTNTPATHAETLIQAYKDMHDADTAPIDAKWEAIRAQTGDRPIFDASQMAQDAQAGLKAKMLSAYDPGGQIAELVDAARRGGMSADQYVAWRQNLGREAMSGGNPGKAASVVLDATNKSDMLPQAAQFRDQVNDALAAGRALHQKIAGDPAYQAVVNGTASTKDFVNKYVTGGKPEVVAQMRTNLSGNDSAVDTLRAAFFDNLRDAARLDDQYQGNFAAKSFDKQLNAITPAARNVFENGELQRLGALSQYAKDIAYSGPDSWRNWSNTATESQTPMGAALAKGTKLLGSAAESYLAAKTGGASIPIISGLKAGAAARKAAREQAAALQQQANYIAETTRPSAGIINR